MADEEHEYRNVALGVEPRRLRSGAAPNVKKPKFEYWDFPSEAAVREPSPLSVSDFDRSSLEGLLNAGSGPLDVAGEDLFVVLGLDFGTSSTKLIVRLPFEPGTPTIAIPAPKACRSREGPYLWRTLLWLREDGGFLPWPEDGAKELNSLKQGLIQGRSDKKVSNCTVPFEVNRAQAGAAYLAFVIRYARGWLLQNRRDLFRGRSPRWFVNLGMPTATYDDPNLVGPYRRIGAAALQLARIDNPVTVKSVQRFLDDLHIREAGASEEAAEALGVAVLPEAAAEVTGFAKSIRGAPGLYFLVDVGALTLDACMFLLSQESNSSNLYAFMDALVRPLGVESFHWFLSEGKTEDQFAEQCCRMLHAIVWNTKVRRNPRADNWKPGNNVPVFLAGGGAANRLHKCIVESLDPWLKENVCNDGIRRLELSVPDTMETPEPLQNLGRMAVAYGLSFPPTEIGRIMPMREIEDVPPPAHTDIGILYISKDQV